MKRLSVLSVTTLSPLALLASCGMATSGDSAQAQASGSPIQVTSGRDLKSEEFATFDQPWGADFIPGTTTLFVTEKPGAAKIIDTRTLRLITVSGLPEVDYGGQGGLGDVAFLPAEAGATVESRTIYLTWAEAGDGDTRGAALGRGLLVCEETDACAIRDLKVIWRQPKVTGRGHYSHRIAISPDGKYLFLSSGDRQKKTPAQDTSNNLGSIVRLNLDGTLPLGNTFTNYDGRAQDIWSYGHRNVLGLAFDAEGRLWDLEHGPAGGDELNLVEPGSNYGWPLRSNGKNYDGSDIPDHRAGRDFEGAEEFTAPAISWNPVISPGDFLFYSGDLFPEWRGQAIIAAMRPAGLVRVSINGTSAAEAGRIGFERRLREIVQGPDGAIWVLEDGADGRLIRLTPP